MIRAVRGDPGPESGHSELFQEMALCRQDRGRRGVQDQHTLARGEVQAKPGVLDFFQLPQAVLAEIPDDKFIALLRLVRAELPVEARPGEPQWKFEGKGPVVEPEVEVEARELYP